MKKKLIFPALVAVGSIALGVGATFALFSSNESSRAELEAGVVKVNFENTMTKALSRFADDTPYNAMAHAGDDNLAVFENGGTASIVSTTGDSTKLVLDRISPMDMVSFKATATNASNINIKFRYFVKLEGELLPALQVKIDGTEYATPTNGKTIYSLWSQAMTPDVESLFVKDVSVYFPYEASVGVDQNSFQGKQCSIEIGIEAIQGNATVVDEISEDPSPAYETIHSPDPTDENKTVVMPSSNGEWTAIVGGGAVDNNPETELSYTFSLREEPAAPIGAGSQCESYDVSFTGIKEGNTEPIIITRRIGAGKQNVKVYHNGEEIPSQYDEVTGYVTFTVTNFSPFDFVWDAPRETSYGFYNSYKVDSGLETEHWVHEISSVSEFKNLVLPNEAAQALADKAGLNSEKTVYVLKDNISFNNKTPWEAMGVTKDEWQNYVFTGTLTGGDTIKNLSDSIIASADCESLTTKKFVGALFSKIETAAISNLTVSNFVVEQGATALESSGILFGGNEPGSTETQHVYNLSVENVTIDETCSILGAKNVGAFMGNVRYFNYLHVNNYQNYATVSSTGYGASGFAGTATGLKEALFENSSNNGTISGNEGRASGFIGAISGIGTGPKQTLSGGFKFLNCSSNGALNDYPTKAMQGGGYFVGLQASTDSAAFSAECANCTIGGTLKTNISESGNFTLAYERNADWIVNKVDMSTLVISNVVAKMGLAGNYSTHRLSVDESGLEVDHYTLTIRMDCYDAKADFDTKTCYSTNGGGKILNIVSSQQYATKADLETNAKMVSRIGYFMPTKDDVTIEKGDVSRYANITAHRFQEFVLDESKRGTEGFDQVLSEDSDGGLRYIAMNNTVDEYERFTVFTRMGTYMHYVVSAFDANGAMIGLGEWTYGIFHIDDDHCNSVLPIGADSYTFYKNYKW